MSNSDKKENILSRRDFIRRIGAAGAVTAGLSACGRGVTAAEGAEGEEGTMTFRTDPSTGDKVSLLGFGMMRLPSVGGRSAREGNEEIDQEMVNELVDYAIKLGLDGYMQELSSADECYIPKFSNKVI